MKNISRGNQVKSNMCLSGDELLKTPPGNNNMEAQGQTWRAGSGQRKERVPGTKGGKATLEGQGTAPLSTQVWSQNPGRGDNLQGDGNTLHLHVGQSSTEVDICSI